MYAVDRTTTTVDLCMGYLIQRKQDPAYHLIYTSPQCEVASLPIVCGDQFVNGAMPKWLKQLALR